MRRMAMVTATGLALMTAISPRASAQNEAALRAAFEGKMLTVKVDMPATSRGIDLFPEEAAPVNWREMADRMKDNGTALKIGQTVMITKVVVKKDSHIELQLGGGGYGTFGDYMTNSSSVSTTAETESPLERRLRDSVKAAPNATKRRQFEKELSSARSERERANSVARAEAAQANEAREANLRVKRIEAGSRFNIRFKRGIPASALTPEGVMAALAQYADFPGAASGGVAPRAASAAAAAPAASGLMALKKGLSISEVEALLGPANTAGESKEGILTLMKRSYLHDGKRVTASFVNGVLIDYAIAPQ